MGLLHIYDNSDWFVRQTANARSGSRTKLPVAGTATGLVDALDTVKGRFFSAILFETHGAPGKIFMGDYAYTASWWRAVKTRGYGSIAATDVRIYFNGCNVAADPGGWDFLTAVAEVFCTPGGGQVFGQTSSGFGNPISGHTVHLWGSTRTLFLDSAGRILERFEQ
jgi:hypothetical protein